MKRILILTICILFCLSAACAKTAPAVETPTEAPAEPTEEPVAATEEPTEEPVVVEATEEPTEEPDEPVPDAGLTFEVTTLAGEEITSEIIKDYDLVILNFWAEWCGPCVDEMPALEQIHQEFPNVLILGAWIGDSAKEAKETADELGVTYPTIKVSGMLEELAGRSMYIPATYFFDKDGNEIGEPVIGGQDYDAWKAVVEGLLQ